MKLNARCSRAACATSFRAEDKKRKEQMKTLSKITLAAAALTLLGIAAALAHGDKGKHSETRWKTIVIDVAVDGRTGMSIAPARPTQNPSVAPRRSSMARSTPAARSPPAARF